MWQPVKLQKEGVNVLPGLVPVRTLAGHVASYQGGWVGKLERKVSKSS